MKKKLSSSTYGTVEEEKEDFFASSSTVDVESLQRRRRDDDDVIIGEKPLGVKPSKNGMMRAKTIALACGACAVTFAVSASVMKGGGSGFVASSSKSPSSSDGAFSLGGLQRRAPKRGFSRGAMRSSAAKSSSSSGEDDAIVLPPINAGFAKVKERVAMERRAMEMENGLSSSSSSSSSALEFPAEEEEPPKREPKTADLGVPMECASCALVLPTPEMSGHSLGKEIDSHDCVARINTHYLDAADEKNAKFREDFGTKTDFVFANVVPHTLDELNRGDHSKIDEKVKHKILVLRTLEEEKNLDASSSTKIPYQDPGSAKPEDVYRFLDANEGWVVTPDVISNEASELFSSLSGTEKKLWSSGFLAYTTLTRHFCASTTVYALPEDEGNDNASKTDYFSTSLSNQRQMWEGHSFGAEHTFMRKEAEMGDYGVAVKTVVDQEKLAREEALRKEQEAAQKEQDEAQAAIAKKEAENEAMISAQHLAAKSAIDAAQEAAAKASLLQQQQAEEIVEDSVPQPEIIAAGEESASTGSEEVVGALTVVDPNTDLVGDQSTCTESFKDLFCNPALQCIAGIPCPGQGCCDRTSCNPADSCMPGIPIPGIGCCRDAEDWRPEWGPSRIDKSNPSALVNIVLEDGTPKSIMVSELDDYINARVLQMTNPPPKDGVEGDIGNGGDEGDDDDTIVPASEKKKIVVKKLKNPKEQKMLFELDGHKHKTKENARLGMAAPTEEELIAALGKHHHHAEQADNEKSATKTKSADMFDMSKVETAKETTWRSGAAGGVTNNQAIKGNNFMKDGKYDPPMFCDDSEHCTPGQRWPGVGCCTPDSCNPDPSPNCQAGVPMPGYGCCSDKNTYRWDDKENRYKKIEYKEVTKDDLQVMMATKSLDVPGIEKPKISYESIIGKDDVDLSSANVEAPDDNVIADFIQGKTPEKETASDESSEEGEEEAKAEVIKEFQELVGDEDTVAVEEKEDAPEAESKPLFCNQQTEGCVAGVPIPGIPCCNAPDICNPEPKETCVAGVPLPGIPCCFQRQPHAQNPGAQKDSALAKSLESSSKQTCNPDPKCTPGVPIPGVGCCKNGWGKVDGNAVDQLDKSTTEKEGILKDSVEALVLKKRIREELQRKDQLVSHNAKEKKAITDADTSGSEKEQKKIEARANTLANEDKPIEDEPVEDVPAHEEKSEKSAEHQRQRRRAEDADDADVKKSSSSKKHKNKASGKPEVWDSDY
tara:strand:- start:425 stop:4096 length:3672 start_codon:yes stop_codon:yes gene_type:complete